MPGKRKPHHLAASAATEIHNSDWFIPQCGSINVFSRDQLQIALQNLGWRKIGQGGFSVVLQHDHRPWLLKIFDNSNQRWLDFIWWARDHADNPHIIRTQGDLIPVTPDFWTVRVEPLECIYHDSFFLRYVDPKLLRSIKHSRHTVMALHHIAENRSWLCQQWPQLAEVLHGLEIVLGNPVLDLDITNIMRRGDTLVYTDPV